MSPRAGEIWWLAGLPLGRAVPVRLTLVTASHVSYRNAYGRHGPDRRVTLALFLSAATIWREATEAAASPKATWARAARLPKSVRRGQAKRITPKQRVAAEQARARGVA